MEYSFLFNDRVKVDHQALKGRSYTGIYLTNQPGCKKVRGQSEAASVMVISDQNQVRSRRSFNLNGIQWFIGHFTGFVTWPFYKRWLMVAN